MPLPMLAETRHEPVVVSMPTADLHLHQEQSPRLDRVLARRERRAPYDWRAWMSRLMRETPPGIARLRQLSSSFPAPLTADADDEVFIARVVDLLDEAAAGGAILVEVRFGKDTLLRPGLMSLFREAERRVRERYPSLRAEAVATLLLWLPPDQLEAQLQASIRAAVEGLGGVDLLYQPYDAEADWKPAYRLADRAAAAGLGITAHAGEFSTANIAAALCVPGLTRLGHAVYAAADTRLLDLLARSGVTVESCLTCNVVLGAAPSYEEHPIRQFVERGIPVALGTDNPVQLCTSIGREYELARALGFSERVLLAFTRNAVRAGFTTPARRTELLAALHRYES